MAAGAPLAQAASRHRVDQKVTLGSMGQSAGFPQPGSHARYAGTVTSRLGRGALIERITITGQPNATTFLLRGTSTAFYRTGTTKSAFTGIGTLRPDGRFAITGRGHYTGGSLYRHARRKYSFIAYAPRPPSAPVATPPPPCAVPAGWSVVASDAQVVVIFAQLGDYQTYEYCNYANAQGFQLLVSSDNNPANWLGGSFTDSSVDGVASSYILYQSTTSGDSPWCNSMGTPAVSSVVVLVDSTTGAKLSGGAEPTIVSALLTPNGIAAWMDSGVPCGGPYGPPPTKYETVNSLSFATGSVTNLDSVQEPPSSPQTLGNLELSQCVGGCSGGSDIVAWTHSGTWRYAQVH